MVRLWFYRAVVLAVLLPVAACYYLQAGAQAVADFLDLARGARWTKPVVRASERTGAWLRRTLGDVGGVL